MAIEFNRNMKILVGVALLAVVGGAGAWFYLDDITSMFAEPPKKVAVAKPAASAAKTASAAKATEAAKPSEAAKPAAEATKVAAAPKAAEPAKAGEAAKGAEPVKTAEAPKGAAEAKPAAKPIPTSPDRLIAEVIETSGVKTQIMNFGQEVGRNASAANQEGKQKIADSDAKALYDVTARVFDTEAMTAEITSTLKASFDADRMTRFLEILRQPISLKMAALEKQRRSPEETAKLLEDIRTNPPSAQRQKLIGALDDITQSSETGVQLATLTAREMMDAMFAEMQKAGKQVPKQARQFVGSRIVAAQGSMRSGFRTMFYLTYRDASDDELAEYVKHLDTDVGRWGLQLLAGAQRTAVESRVRPFAKEVAQIAVRSALAKGKATPIAVAAQEEKPAEKAVAEAPAAPAAAEPPVYKRAPDTRVLYSRYNDLITATVMRDSTAVKELLADGKYPDVRQKDGVTPLMIAASNGDVETASLLLGKGADPNLRAAGGRSALSLARQKNAAAMVQLLQSKGAKE